MSVLVPCQKPLLYRACTEEQRYHLLNWFGWIEMLVWERVHAYYRHDRPSKIFLVTGQTLSPGYAIAHKESSSTECQVLLSANAAIPTLLDTKALTQYGIERAQATLGFEEVKSEEDNRMYSIFLDVYPSCSVRRFKVDSLKARVEDMYKYLFSL